MPLGGSVTYGSESTDGNGYRRILQEILVSDGYIVDMVGSRKSGSMQNNDNEGWRGFRIEQVTNKAKGSVPSLLPNLFTVNVGSNDCVQDFEIETAGKRMSDMLEYLWTASAGSTVVLSTLLPNLDGKIESRVLRVNEQFWKIAKAKTVEGKKVIIVDMHGSDGPQISDLADGTHPNDVGYAKMATIWRRGIHEAVHKDFIQEPL
ncbi:Lipase GDSL [Penicillium samsonianum]|uniref:Lipase GDSL n=1 Tax=Penicillium samsonianum TaxID=1882272 RepID=UPI0025496FEF|nr:Lipase GDSL [Penicillium samsonianum]KAJ6127941.1 Lipase GDSL [Penicillium samsonianum]